MPVVPIDIRETPYRHDIEVTADSSERRWMTFRLRTDEGVAALVLTGVSYMLKVSTAPGGDQLVSATTITDWTSSGVMVDDAIGGELSIWLTAADIALCGVGEHYWSLSATFPADHEKLGGYVRTLVHGTLRVTPQAVG
jgi:hypothetical protein